METISNIIKDWPVIVQGALGSALFWLALIVGKKVIDFSKLLYSKHSESSRRTWLTNRSGMIMLVLNKETDEQSHMASLLLYRASRYLFKALMWLVLGLLMQIVYPVIAVIGYLGCLFYLMEGFTIVGGTGESEEELIKELETIRAELDTLG